MSRQSVTVKSECPMDQLSWRWQARYLHQSETENISPLFSSTLSTLLGVQSELLALGIMLYIPQNTNIHENMFLIVLSDSGDNLKRKLVGYNASNVQPRGHQGYLRGTETAAAMADYRQIFSLDSILMVWYNIENFRSIKVSPIHLVDAGGSGWCTELRIGSLREFRGGQTFKSSVNDRTLNLKSAQLMVCIL